MNAVGVTKADRLYLQPKLNKDWDSNRDSVATMYLAEPISVEAVIFNTYKEGRTIQVGLIDEEDRSRTNQFCIPVEAGRPRGRRMDEH